MHSNIKITEEDIFKFVFNPESLSKEILDYLTQNQDHFAAEISFCKEMNSAPSALSNKIASEIFDKLTNSSIIELSSNDINSELNQGIKLAAATSPQSNAKVQSSYSDPDMNYLIRLVNVHSQNLLYFFSNDKEEKHYTIKFLPSENEYEITDTTKPVEIIEEKLISKVIVLIS